MKIIDVILITKDENTERKPYKFLHVGNDIYLIRSAVEAFVKGACTLTKALFVQCKLYQYISLILLEKPFDEV